MYLSLHLSIFLHIHVYICISLCVPNNDNGYTCYTYPYEKSKILFSYMLYAYSIKEHIGELNLKRALDEFIVGRSASIFHTIKHIVKVQMLI